MKRPVVGIIGNSFLINDQYPVQCAGIHNMEAVSHVSQAMPVMIPANPNLLSVAELVSHFDGFVFTGARANVHPAEYGEDATPAHGELFDRSRDSLTLPLIRAAVEAALPVLGICRGFQEFNVAFGGTLYPEIRDLPGRMNHRMPPDGTLEEKFAHRHEIVLDEGSIFTRIFGANRVMTNTLHGQGIKTAGPRIIIEGHAPDGTPEAIRIRDAENFALAVQWHPEWRASTDPVSKPLFEAFGAALRGGHAAAARTGT